VETIESVSQTPEGKGLLDLLRWICFVARFVAFGVGREGWDAVELLKDRTEMVNKRRGTKKMLVVDEEKEEGRRRKKKKEGV
jgi:hypothetical protein